MIMICVSVSFTCWIQMYYGVNKATSFSSGVTNYTTVGTSRVYTLEYDTTISYMDAVFFGESQNPPFNVESFMVLSKLSSSVMVYGTNLYQVVVGTCAELS